MRPEMERRIFMSSEETKKKKPKCWKILIIAAWILVDSPAVGEKTHYFSKCFIHNYVHTWYFFESKENAAIFILPVRKCWSTYARSQSHLISRTRLDDVSLALCCHWLKELQVVLAEDLNCHSLHWQAQNLLGSCPSWPKATWGRKGLFLFIL